MLTDRQNKFYIRIKKLSTDDVHTSEKERKYLAYCAKELEAGVEPFKSSINRLNYGLLENLQKRRKKSLSEEVSQLTSDLVEVYGEPIKIVHGIWDADVPLNTTFYL